MGLTALPLWAVVHTRSHQAVWGDWYLTSGSGRGQVEQHDSCLGAVPISAESCTDTPDFEVCVTDIA